MLKVIFFDLDGTLYKSTEVRQKFAEAAYHTFSKYKETSLENAQKLIEEKREELKKEQSDSVPYTLTLRSFGIPIEIWHKENIKYFDPRQYLRQDEKLQQSFKELKNNYRLAILTNNNDTQADRVLEALGLRNMFERIYTYNSFKLLKPDHEFFRKAAEDLRVLPEECLVVGDRYNVDLEPAEKLNMYTYKVSGPDDIYQMDNLIREKFS